MPSWTKEQERAIYESGTNMIISAGAGSGKTAVLTERVIQKLKQGIHINELLILTFTKAAAQEMQERIRLSIMKDDTLKDELDLIDTAYITTFDSYALSLVKKYHYLLNVPKDIEIISSVLMEGYKKELLDNLFDEYYEQQDSNFYDFINHFCIKDDKSIKKMILNILNKLELIIDVDSYLDNYINYYFSDEYINSVILEFSHLIDDKKEELKYVRDELSFLVDGDYLTKLDDVLGPFLDDKINLGDTINIKLPNLPRGIDNSVKDLKKELNNILKEIQDLLSYGTCEDIFKSFNDIKMWTTCLINLFKQYIVRLNQYKKEHDYYEFTDIALLALNILKKDDISNQIKNTFKEILVDEYQDTNDIQDTFLKLIENNNIYMVGDIKQSIYRFRNANPSLFQTKYELYSQNNGGIKIDLIKNFRSRREVLDNINAIFNLIMDRELGGANYPESHQMVFGNLMYEENKTDQNYQMTMLEYPDIKNLDYSKEEVEAFIIADDIKRRVANHEQIVDKKTNKLRDIKYSDCAILMDRTTSFNLYKQIFDYLNIPLSLYKDETLNDSTDIYLLHHLLELTYKVSKGEFDNIFRYDFVSIARSYLFNWDDDTIFNCFLNNDFYHNDIYDICYNISKQISSLNSYTALELLIDECHLYERLITVGDIENRIMQIDKILETSASLVKLGYDIPQFLQYISEALSQNYELKYTKEVNSNCVSIMTIHKSKGLEFPICYFSGLTRKFNIREINDKLFFHNKYGIVMPYFDEGLKNTIVQELVKKDYLTNEISEKIRLFYVALTRAREKMIFVLPEITTMDKPVKQIISRVIRYKYRSFYDILVSIKPNLEQYYHVIDLNSLNLTHQYLYQVESINVDNNNEIDSLVVEPLSSIKIRQTKQTFSKRSTKLYSKREYHYMQVGTMIHEILETINIKAPDWNLIKQYPYHKEITMFLKQDLFKNIKEADVYHEYAFMQNSDKVQSGVIDLMLIYDNHVDIIDYKLKHTSDKQYIKQLIGYQEYISKLTNKKVNLYLYSIINNEFISIDNRVVI